MRAFLAIVKRRPELTDHVKLVYDAEAMFAKRDILESQLTGNSIECVAAEAMLAEEISLAAQAHLVLSVSSNECAEFRRAGISQVELLGHMIEPAPGPSAFAQRRDLLFVGRLSEERSPNVDGLIWFCHEVLPLLRQSIGERVRLIVAGKNGAPSPLQMTNPAVILLGQVPDLAPLYDRARVFVAPTRYAAGIPIKVYEAAAHGVPSVVTPLLADQLGWCDEKEVLVGLDSQSFATQTSRLYHDEALWTRLRENALERIRKDCDPARFRQTIGRILGMTQMPP
jgi:O-antigen biosynthesis protein